MKTIIYRGNAEGYLVVLSVPFLFAKNEKVVVSDDVYRMLDREGHLAEGKLEVVVTEMATQDGISRDQDDELSHKFAPEKESERETVLSLTPSKEAEARSIRYASQIGSQMLARDREEPWQGVEPSQATKFCRHCGVKILRDSRFCEECGMKLTSTPAIPSTATVGVSGGPQKVIKPGAATIYAKPDAGAHEPRAVQIMRVSAVVFILCALVAILFVPWVPVVKSEGVEEKFTYSYTYPVTERREIRHQEVVFASGVVNLRALKSSILNGRLALSSFHLEKGWEVQVTLETDSSEIVICVKDEVDGETYFCSEGRGGRFIAPRSGDYRIVLGNVDMAKDETASVQLTADWTEIQYVQKEASATKTVTLSVTRHNVTYVNPIDFFMHEIW